MRPFLNDYGTALVLLLLMFSYLEYRFKPDIFYVVERLFTARKYWMPLLILPVAYALIKLLISLAF